MSQLKELNVDSHLDAQLAVSMDTCVVWIAGWMVTNEPYFVFSSMNFAENTQIKND